MCSHEKVFSLKNKQYTIRLYQPQDRGEVRRISCETACLGISRHNLFSDDELLADALTLYYTDFEPESCLVAVSDHRVVGYLIGARTIRLMNLVFASQILRPLFLKALRRKCFFHRTNRNFLLYVLRSFIRGEFTAPCFSKEYPATLHINLEKEFTGRGIGSSLIREYLKYLKNNNIAGVHFATFSEGAKSFFLLQGFEMLFQGPRTYLEPYVHHKVMLYIFGKKL
jgi:GNAT superfamily N-acetyltransferase